MEDVEDEVRLLRIERDEYKEQFQAMTKFLQDYGALAESFWPHSAMKRT